MPTLELPHTPGCLVCGRENPHGLHLSFFVDPQTGIVETKFTSRAADIGFPQVIHGGIIATVLDEAMVWAATWAGKRFCLCGELTTRFRQPVVDEQRVNRGWQGCRGHSCPRPVRVLLQRQFQRGRWQ